MVQQTTRVSLLWASLKGFLGVLVTPSGMYGPFRPTKEAGFCPL